MITEVRKLLNENASTFYLTLEEKEKNGRYGLFLRKNSQEDVADELVELEDRIYRRQLEKQLEEQLKCKHCHGLGYTEEKTGVVSPHIPYIEETYKEPCCHCNGTGEADG
jgi:DnaJ-class molecular chaperone